MSPPLIKAVKSKIDTRKHVLIDAPPGTSCPAVTAVQGSNFCLLVTEPTPFGLNDLDLAVQLLKKLDIPAGVLINRADIEQRRRGILPGEVRLCRSWDRIAVLYARGNL